MTKAKRELSVRLTALRARKRVSIFLAAGVFCQAFLSISKLVWKYAHRSERHKSLTANCFSLFFPNIHGPVSLKGVAVATHWKVDIALDLLDPLQFHFWMSRAKNTAFFCKCDSPLGAQFLSTRTFGLALHFRIPLPATTPIEFLSHYYSEVMLTRLKYPFSSGPCLLNLN